MEHCIVILSWDFDGYINSLLNVFKNIFYYVYDGYVMGKGACVPR